MNVSYVVPYLIPAFLYAFNRGISLGYIFLQKEKVSVEFSDIIMLNIFCRKFFPFAKKPI